jgi:hypothetical protein
MEMSKGFVRTIAGLTIAMVIAAVTIIGFATFGRAVENSTTAQEQFSGPFAELLDVSMKEKKGVTFYIKGQTIPGVVVKKIGDNAVEVRSQTYNRGIIRLDTVDAVTLK